MNYYTLNAIFVNKTALDSCQVTVPASRRSLNYASVHDKEFFLPCFCFQL